MAERQKGRTCGGCTACCKPFTIPEIDKLDGGWCVHSIKGKGCGIYETHPAVCRRFECLWLYGYDDEENRPDKAGFFVANYEPIILHGLEIPHFIFYETYPGGLDGDHVVELTQLRVENMDIVSSMRMTGPTTYERNTRFSGTYSREDAALIMAALQNKESKPDTMPKREDG